MKIHRKMVMILASLLGASIIAGCSSAVPSSVTPDSSVASVSGSASTSVPISNVPGAATSKVATLGSSTPRTGKAGAVAGPATPVAATPSGSGPGIATPGATPRATPSGATEGTTSQGGGDTAPPKVDVLLRPPGSLDIDAIDAELNAMQRRLDGLHMPSDSDFNDAAGALY